MIDTKNEIMKVFKELLPKAQRALVMCARSARRAERPRIGIENIIIEMRV